MKEYTLDQVDIKGTRFHVLKNPRVTTYAEMHKEFNGYWLVATNSEKGKNYGVTLASQELSPRVLFPNNVLFMMNI